MRKQLVDETLVQHRVEGLGEVQLDHIDVVAVFDGGAPILDCLQQLHPTRPLWEEAVLRAGEQTVFTELLEESISDNGIGFKNFDRDGGQSDWSIARRLLVISLLDDWGDLT